ncbi:MAG: site-specific integrase, partial [Desulfosalsimonas sp.]
MNEIAMHMDQYLNYLVVEKGLADATVASYGSDLARFQRFLTASKIRHTNEVDAAAILKYLLRLRDNGLGIRS